MTRPLIAYYGDDFTGSADVMEVLQWAGLRTVLFLDPPSSQELDRFNNLRAFGVAGWSRTMSPTEMESELRPALIGLRDSGAPIVHYKTCSTFDSSPQIGSIGKALEIGREVFGGGVIPIVIAVPNLGRYQAFGNLFARSGLDTPPFRLDRHPTMRQHPITPMSESDIRVHLASQTDLRVGLVDVLRFNESNHMPSLDCDALIFDAVYPEHMPKIGEMIQALIDAKHHSCFALGSSGVEYALSAFWTDSGTIHSLQSHPSGHPAFSEAEQLVVLTGSCSPVNARQIDWAEQNGFHTIPINTAQLVDPNTDQQQVNTCIEHALERLGKGANVILHSSRGPDDQRVAETLKAFQRLGMNDFDIRLKSGRTLGPKLGRILGGILSEHHCKRVGVAGGDTSGYIARELGLSALEAIAPVAPGSPLCRAYASNRLNGVEFFFKGGQVGKDNVWGTMLTGTDD